MITSKALAIVPTKELIINIPVEETSNGVKLMGKFEGALGVYEIYSVGDGPLVATPAYSLYVTKLPSGQFGLMKISQGSEWNEVLSREAKLLASLQKIASDLDDEASAAGETPPFYGAFFPTLIEHFVPEEVDREVLFLGYHPSIVSYKQFLPLSQMLGKSRVDLQTASWILAKGSKLLGFLHDLGFSVGFMHPSNFLLETEKHGVFILDLSQVNETPNEEECLGEVRSLARFVWNVAGGSSTKKPAHDREIMSAEHYQDFISFIKDLVEGDTKASDVLPALYEKADVYWPKVPIGGNRKNGLKRQFHPWKIFPR